jgi:hypothetical protein
MPDLYLHPDGDALLVDPQGKLTADPACCCDDAIVIELVIKTRPSLVTGLGYLYLDGVELDQSPHRNGMGDGRLSSVFSSISDPVFDCRFEQAVPRCSVCDGVPYSPFATIGRYPRLSAGLRTFTFVTRIVGRNALLERVAVHVYTARREPFGAYWRAAGMKTLLCVVDAAPVDVHIDESLIIPYTVATYEFPFTYP